MLQEQLEKDLEKLIGVNERIDEKLDRPKRIKLILKNKICINSKEHRNLLWQR